MEAPNTLPLATSSNAPARALEADIREELHAHLELATDQGIEDGLSPEEARAQALERFGDLEQTIADCARQKTGNALMWKRLNLLAIAGLLIGCAMLANTANQRRRQAREHEVALRAMESRLLKPQEIIVAIGDRIELVDGYQPGEFEGTHTVDRDGTALLPQLGHVSVHGMSRTEVEDELRERYAAYYEMLDLYVRVLPPE